jgi:hypothetical protein
MEKKFYDFFPKFLVFSLSFVFFPLSFIFSSSFLFSLPWISPFHSIGFEVPSFRYRSGGSKADLANPWAKFESGFPQ